MEENLEENDFAEDLGDIEGTDQSNVSADDEGEKTQENAIDGKEETRNLDLILDILSFKVRY